MNAEALSLWDCLPDEDPDGLRDYQREAVEAIRRELAEHRSTLAVMATGLGKTQVFGAVAKHWPGNVLVLAHRDELVQQAKKRLEQMTGEWVDVEQGTRQCGTSARLVVGSVATVQRKRRLERLGADRFQLIIADEAHHYPAKTYRRPLDYFADAKVLGVTATPDRTDKRALKTLFDSVAYRMDILAGIDAGYLVDVHGREVAVKEIDLSGVGKVAKDLNLGQLDEAMVKAVEGIVKKTLELEPDRQGIAFFPGVKSAELAAERFNALKPGSAICITGKTDPDLRKQMVRDFKEGRAQYFCNCAVATEGFDAPAASVVIIGRPTLSRSLYAQMVGRGTRPLPGVTDGLVGKDMNSVRRDAIRDSAKPNCLILDFVGNSGKHSLVSPVDILGGNYTEAEQKVAKKKLKRGGDVQTALRDAREELQRMAQKMESRVQASVRDFDPFRSFDAARTLGVKMDREEGYSRHFGFKPATPAQRRGLVAAGVDEKTAKELSFHAASKMYEALNKRRQKGQATLGQIRKIREFCPAPDAMSFDRARLALNYIASTGWGKRGPLDAGRLHELCFGARMPGE